MDIVKLYFNSVSIIGFFLVFGIGTFVYIKKRKIPTNKYWFILCICAASWMLLFFFIINSDNKGASIFIRYFMDLSVIVMILFWLKFVFSFLKVKKKSILYLLYATTLLMIFFNFSPWFITGMRPKYMFNYYVEAGVGYYIFSIYFLFFVYYGLKLLFNEYKKSTGIRSSQIKYIIIGSSLGFIGGGSAFFISFNIPILPYPFILYAIFPLIIVYGIVKYRLMDIRAIVFRSLAFGSLILLITITFAIISGLIATLFQDLLGFKSNIIAGLIVGILVSITYQPLRLSIEGITNQFLYKKSYNPDQLLSQISEVTSSILDLHNLLASICATLDESFHTQKLGIALLNQKQKLEVAFQNGFAPDSAEKLVAYPKAVATLQQELKNLRGMLVIDEMKTQYENGEFKPIDVQLLLALYENDLALILPLYVKEQLIGIIALGNKKSGDPYNHQDLSILKIIAGQIAIAIENARLYDELKDFNVKLEEEVRRKTAQLRKANQELRQLDQAKSEFISIASHQLRTPLTVIKGYISMMREGSFGPVSPVIMENLEKVYASNERLIGLVENLLDISRIESGRQEFDWKKVRLENIAQTVVDNLKNTAKIKNLKLVFNKPKVLTPEVTADPNKIHEVMMNFVDNAIKYTEKGDITVSLLAEPKKDLITFYVKDSGRGIDKTMLPYLFRKFSRGKGSFRVHTEGVGLGLYVAKMIIDAHQGKIWVESEGQDKGSKFCFSLSTKIGLKELTANQPEKKFGESKPAKKLALK